MSHDSAFARRPYRFPGLRAASLLAVLAFAAPLRAQDTTQVWSPRTLTVADGEQFHSLSFANADTGYIISTHAVHRTVDGGETWTALPKPADAGQNTLQKVDFVTGKIGWIVCNGGVIVKTTDAGATWTRQESGTTRNLYLLQFLDADHGWAKEDGDSLLRTVNGGFTWTRHHVATQGLTAVQFVTPDTGWLVGTMERKLRSIDGGQTWTDLTDYGAAVRRDLEAIHFVTREIGWVAGGSTAYISKTMDGGVTWTAQPPGAFGGIRGLAFVDTLTGWAVGAGGTLLKTLDGGATWHDQDFADQFVNEVGFGEPFAHVQALGVDDAVAMSYQLVVKTPETTTSVSAAPVTTNNSPMLTMNGAQRIRYTLPAPAGRVRLDVLDARGAVVATLVNGPRGAGEHAAALETGKIPAGVYMLRLSVGTGHNAREALRRIVVTR